jgi:hypothetical protein
MKRSVLAVVASFTLAIPWLSFSSVAEQPGKIDCTGILRSGSRLVRQEARAGVEGTVGILDFRLSEVGIGV